LTDEQSESVGSNSNISQELGGIQPKTIRRSLNWQNISVEAPSRGNGMSLPGGIQRQQEEQEETPEIQAHLAADSAQKSVLDSSNSTISTDLPAQNPLIARAPFNGRNIPVEAPQSSVASSAYPEGIQRLKTSDVNEQEESKEEQNKELVQTKSTVGVPGDKYEQEADNMAAKIMRMPDSTLQHPIQRQTNKETEELIPGKVATFDYTEEDIIKGSKNYREGILNQLGLKHTAKGHDPSIPDQTLANNARMQGGSGKWLSHRAMIEAAKLAKATYPNPEPGEAYFIPIPPEWAKGYRRVKPGEAIKSELYVLPDEGVKKPGVIEVTITQARVFFNEQKNVRSVHPYSEAG
jgi:hypothetical protein